MTVATQNKDVTADQNDQEELPTNLEGAAPAPAQGFGRLTWIEPVYIYANVSEAVHGNRTETFDIGAEDQMLRVQPSDVFRKGMTRYLEAINPLTNKKMVNRDAVETLKEKKRKLMNRLTNSIEGLTAIGATAGKRIVCTQCKNAQGEPECTWHASVVYDAQVRGEAFLKGYVASRKVDVATGEITEPETEA